MLLSVIIVNYNVKYFLEQCLCSVSRAVVNGECPSDRVIPVRTGTGGRAGAMGNGQIASGDVTAPLTMQQIEVFVVDNNSADGSVEYLQEKFPLVQFIANTENVGFAKANNQALLKVTGKYILFLNPDTIVPEDGFANCIAFMEAHAGAGALGVHMIDGSGQFLPESKRGFPSPWVSFCKMSGLTGLFPSSKIFAGYYLGHLPEQETAQVDILSGAYMLVRKEVLDKTGGFDEQFFMYAEDIDLSYRIQQAGYINYYFHDCTIIHFKGESTRKDNRYIKIFYKAMIQFVRKHFSGHVAWLYTGLLKGAIGWKTMTGSREPKVGSRKEGKMVFITGDGKSMFEVREAFTGKMITTEKEQADEIVFCEGNHFSFVQMIHEVQQLQGSKKVYIHGKGTGSVVGSSSKKMQGDSKAIRQ